MAHVTIPKDLFDSFISHLESIDFADHTADAQTVRAMLTVVRLVAQPCEPSHELLARQIAWSRKTFGPNKRTQGILEHIRKELKEVEADPSDVTEWIDVAILAVDGAWRHCGSDERRPETLGRIVENAYRAKLQRNFERIWPDWRERSEDQAIEHVR